ncbi:hypothetical protein Glove_109g66 [Diversispora epigaea]|uniref:Uncharacterized protein n=1 Tax=Diversispora epigaea TaxID=1348612 RepID=A0A397J223_9GLOM|nr:hypothetical protein Glove_109g66 [Diversispora epigaea]
MTAAILHDYLILLEPGRTFCKKKIHTVTKIPMSTIYYNLKRLGKTEKILQLKGVGRSKVISRKMAQKIRRQIQKNLSILTRGLVTEPSRAISQPTILRHLQGLDY